jgi:hypothetical protein
LTGKGTISRPVFSFDLPMSISGQCTFPASKMLEMYIGGDKRPISWAT